MAALFYCLKKDTAMWGGHSCPPPLTLISRSSKCGTSTEFHPEHSRVPHFSPLLREVGITGPVGRTLLSAAFDFDFKLFKVWDFHRIVILSEA
jgi:hypothetical protein